MLRILRTFFPKISSFFKYLKPPTSQAPPPPQLLSLSLSTLQSYSQSHSLVFASAYNSSAEHKPQNMHCAGVLFNAFLKLSALLHHHHCQSLPPAWLETSHSLVCSPPTEVEISQWMVGLPQISLWWVDLDKQMEACSSIRGYQFTCRQPRGITATGTLTFNFQKSQMP